MRTTAILGVLLLGLAALALGIASAAVSHKPPLVEPALPPGIVIEIHGNVGGEGNAGRRLLPPIQAVMTTAEGRALYTSDLDTDPSTSACVGDCAAAWPPLTAPSDAKPFGQWSAVSRPDGRKQWAYRGKPLYTSVKDTKPGDTRGDKVDGKWHLTGYAPPPTGVLPGGIAVRVMFNAAGEVFVSDAGKPLYVFDGDPDGKATCVKVDCASLWSPLRAGWMDKAVGDFTVIHRADGIDQWAYRGRALYTFAGDTATDDVRGDKAENSRWHAALAASYFMPPGVGIRISGYGSMYLADAQGITLYVRDRYDGEHQGHSMRLGSRGIPPVGRALGLSTCDDDCTKTWRPFRAAADAQPSAFWQIAVRSDGTRQWVYNGYPLYTYVGDERPGDMRGNEKFDLLKLADDPFEIVEKGNPQQGPGTMYWHAEAP